MQVIDVLNRLLGDPNDREVRKLQPLVQKVRAVQNSDAYQNLRVSDLPKKTEEFRARVTSGERLESILPEAFALVNRACELIRGKSVTVGKQTLTWDMVPFDVQIVGGVVLHQGKIAEMKTGEGKTLVCTMSVYLNALAGMGVHVVTVNDYLARRDALWMGMLYESLGLSIGVIVHDTPPEARKAAYAADVTYGTNNEFGFDYLRDNMATSLSNQVQRGLHFAIVDEVDSILVDEARTPLIISQPAGESTEKYILYARLVRGLQENIHYTIDLKQRVAILTEDGVRKMEELLGVGNIYTEKGFEEVHHIEQALRAHAIYKRDVDYVEREGEIVIVDEFTGRLMPGRRYSHGLHQAIEAKEGVQVQRESRTLATITFQNYFRMYKKLAGMTGTAKTEEEEFLSIYRLPVLVVPTHMPMIRTDKSDAIYRTVEAKFRAVADIAKEKYGRSQPVLIGTTSIEKSEVLSSLLAAMDIPHQVLNAKQHEREAEIVAKAGQRGAVTIATNMAGRGTDIKLGDGVSDLGGLVVLGTERHEARRIDNQLRGRAGRQGDPGESQFFVSMEDELMRLFGGDRLKALMERLKVPEDQPLENPIVSRSIEGAQKRVEGRNFDIRRHVVQYDDVMNQHRDIIYKRRQCILEKIGKQKEEGKQEDQPLHEDVLRALKKEAEAAAAQHAQSIDSDKWDHVGIREFFHALHPVLSDPLSREWLLSSPTPEALQKLLEEHLVSFYEQKCTEVVPHVVAQAERIVTLRAIDAHWMDHIDDMAHLREQVSFAGFAQRDPLIEYKDQGFRRFQQLLQNIDATIVRTLLQVEFREFLPRLLLEQAETELTGLQTNVDAIEKELANTGVGDSVNPVMMKEIGTQESQVGIKARRETQKIGRNNPCPCGSGKKFKKCHGR